MKVLVTGGGGFIGKVMAQHLVDKGFEVRVLDVRSVLEPNKFLRGVEYVMGSILDISDVNKAVRGCDYVVHLAAMLGVKRTEIKRMDCLNINIQGTINILEACIKERVKKILFSSSSEVYGDQQVIPIKETNPLHPKSIYGVTKVVCEHYLQAYKQDYDLDYSIIRFFNVYGPGQVAEFVMPRFIKAVIEDIPPTVYGTGNQVRAFCYVEDAVKGAMFALTNDKANNEIFNIGNDTEPITMKELAEKVIAVSGKELKPTFIPMEQSDRNENREIEKRIPDVTKAKQILSYAPKITLNEGIKRVIEFGNIEETWFEPMIRPKD